MIIDFYGHKMKVGDDFDVEKLDTLLVNLSMLGYKHDFHIGETSFSSAILEISYEDDEYLDVFISYSRHDGYMIINN